MMYEMKFLVVSPCAPFLFLAVVSDVFEALHGRTSLSWLSNTLPQFGIISRWSVIFQVTCLIFWLMTNYSWLWTIEWNQKLLQVCLTSSFQVKAMYSSAIPVLCDWFPPFSISWLLITSPVWFLNAEGWFIFKTHLGPRGFVQHGLLLGWFIKIVDYHIVFLDKYEKCILLYVLNTA